MKINRWEMRNFMRSFIEGNFTNCQSKSIDTIRMMHGKSLIMHKKRWKYFLAKWMNSRIPGIMRNASGSEFIHMEKEKMGMS